MDDERGEQSPLPSTVDDALTATALGFGIGGAAVAMAFPPAAVALGVAAGPTQLLQLVQRRWGKRLSQVAYGARERLGPEEPEAARRLTEDEDLAALAYQALDASLLSHHDEQARALGRVIGEALKRDPTISVDEASMIIEAFRSLDLPHFVALRALQDAPPPELPAAPSWSHIIKHALAADDVAVAAIGSALVRSGAVVIDPPDFGGFHITALGLRLLHYISDGS